MKPKEWKFTKWKYSATPIIVNRDEISESISEMLIRKEKEREENQMASLYKVLGGKGEGPNE